MTAGHSVYLNVDLARRSDIAIANIFDAWCGAVISEDTLFHCFLCNVLYSLDDYRIL